MLVKRRAAARSYEAECCVVRRAVTVVNCDAVLPARPHQLKLDSDDLIETLDDKRKLLRRRATELRADSLNGERSNLADLDPRALSQLRRF